MTKRKKPKLRLWTAIICLVILGLIILGGYHADKNNERYADNRFLDGFSFCVSAGKLAEPKVEEVTPEEKTEREEIEEFGLQLFGKDWSLFKKIIKCESGFRPEAVSKTNDTGLSQINGVHGIPQRWLKDWRINLLVASILWDEGRGINHWNSSRWCWGK